MKKEIDKTHWSIQFSVLLITLFLFIFLGKIISLEEIYASSKADFLSFIPPFLSILLVILSLSLNKKKLFSERYWYLNDFVYWNVFSFLLSLIAIFHGIYSNIFFLIFSQVFAYISLFLGYANELRNEIIDGKFKKGK